MTLVDNSTDDEVCIAESGTTEKQVVIVERDGLIKGLGIQDTLELIDMNIRQITDYLAIKILQ